MRTRPASSAGARRPAARAQPDAGGAGAQRLAAGVEQDAGAPAPLLRRSPVRARRLRMEPTPKALKLQAPVRAILERVRSLRSEHVSFDPRISHRTFNFCVVDAGLIKLLPPLVDRLMAEAPNVRLNVLQIEAAHLEPWLESGKLDFAMGSFPSLTKGIRRQPLWIERYVSVVRRATRAFPRSRGARLCGRKARPGLDCRQRSRAPDHGTGIGGGDPAREHHLPHPDVHRRGGAGKAHRCGRDAAAVDRHRAGGGPRPANHQAADQIAEDRHLPILARPVSSRAGQSMDALDLQELFRKAAATS